MEETIITGNAFSEKKKFLHEVKKDVVNWKIYYLDMNTNEKWVQEYPHSEYHGGGEPHLRLISEFPWEVSNGGNVPD